MAMMYKVTFSLVYEVTLSLVHKITLRAIYIQDLFPLFGVWDHLFSSVHWDYEDYYLFSDKHQAYTVLQNLQKRYSLSDRLVAAIIELLKLSLQG